MALFDIFKKSTKPYKDESANFIYELMFCDNIDLYRKNSQQPGLYPWNILFSKATDTIELQKIINDSKIESRTKILAYNKLRAAGHSVDKKELLAVIVEVGLDEGLDVLASFQDGTARYINQSGKMIIWETQDDQSSALTNQLFTESAKVVQQIGPWHEARRPHPTTGKLRITFLVSDGLYFGEGPADVLFNDPMGGPALLAATGLMRYLTEKAGS